ncbi:molybdopterin molybdotransferase MoeA [Chryseobacterium gregarium]|uniref:molybdopterin molybdotransferase MoeA n=1 Tax=Chryseobacterium gregarium TaxID=456299 RepID=UPI000424FD92|nr:gephyrin-like molybdotransferase Glp [Chryseobacterium gregarium]
MISVQEAQQIILQNIPTKKTALVPLSKAAGLVVSSDITARTDIPAFPQSSMDGYALKFEDRNNPLMIKGEMAAGTSQLLTIETGEATRIFTGAPLPEGADTVVMQEKIKIENGRLMISDDALSSGLNVRPKGSEVRKGEAAMAAGTYLSPAAIGFLAGIGHDRVEVYVPPAVAIIITGNELQDPGHDLVFGQVFEANSFQLKAALRKTGITDIQIFTAGDHPEELMQVLKQALTVSDVVLLNGGVSVGDYDFVTAAAEQCGVIQQFHKIKQKPGKPLFFGTKDDKLIFGLPGNPSSSLTCFYEYVLPALEQLTGLKNSVKKKEAIVSNDYKKSAGLTHFLKAYYDEEQEEVSPLYAQESYRLHSFAQANCFIVLPEDSTGCLKGDRVEVHLLPI